MAALVADTSGLVSLGVGADGSPDPLERCLAEYDLHVPETVLGELEEVASYDDAHGRAANRVLERSTELSVRTVSLDADFPLEDGENAAVTLANEIGADFLLCDEFTRIGLVHASLAGPRLVTTPTLLAALVRADHLRSEDAVALLDAISDVRSWENNSYVQRARSQLEST